MKRFNRIATRIAILATLCVTSMVSNSAAQLFETNVAPNPRSLARGQAMTAVADDAWSYFYNPAMLPHLDMFKGGVSTVEPHQLSFHRQTTLAVASPLQGNLGGVSFGWRHYSVESGSTDLVTENTLSIAHGFRLFEDASTSASIGWALNLYHVSFAPSIGTGGGVGGIDPGGDWTAGIDVGAVVSVYERTWVGFFTRNLNTPEIGVDGEELQRTVGVGLGYQPYPGVVTAFDVRSSINEKVRILGGLEFEVVPQLEVRFGLETEPSKVTGGFGVNFPYVSVDYGFSSGGGTLNATHQFGLTTSLDLLKGDTP